MGPAKNCKLTFKLGVAFKLRWGGPAKAGLARPGLARPGPGGTFNKGPEGPGTLLQVLRRTGGGIGLTLDVACRMAENVKIEAALNQSQFK